MLRVSGWPDGLFTSTSGRPHLRLVDSQGTAQVVSLPIGRWHGPPEPEELVVLARARGPVLDVGCGPGRHVRALMEASVVALGIDVSIAAVLSARRRGAPAVRASVFGDVPGAGRWLTILLLNGNIGIGGDPVVLLDRCSKLLHPGGTLLAELGSPGVAPGRFDARVEHDGLLGPSFGWARVGPDQISGLAARAGFWVSEVWEVDGRWFAQLDR